MTPLSLNYDTFFSNLKAASNVSLGCLGKEAKRGFLASLKLLNFVLEDQVFLLLLSGRCCFFGYQPRCRASTGNDVVTNKKSNQCFLWFIEMGIHVFHVLSLCAM